MKNREEGAEGPPEASSVRQQRVNQTKLISSFVYFANRKFFSTFFGLVLTVERTRLLQVNL